MTEIGTNPQDTNTLFSIYDKPNPIEESHRRAIAYQAILRAWDREVKSDEIDDLIDQAISELDTDLGYVHKQIRVTGNVKVKTIDLRGVDEQDDGSFEASAIIETHDFYDDEPFESLGFAIDRDDEQLTISHLARTPLEAVTSTVKYGEIYKNKRIYIPLDGTAHVEPEKDLSDVDVDVLEYHLGELLTDIDIALLNAEGLSDALQRLGTIDLTPYKILDDDREVAQLLGFYMHNSLEISKTTPFSISGADSIRIINDDGEFVSGEIDPSLSMVGNIIGTAIDFETSRLTVLTNMPFENDTERMVLYRLNDTITVTEHPTFSFG
jgi:hypothetical protein